MGHQPVAAVYRYNHGRHNRNFTEPIFHKRLEQAIHGREKIKNAYSPNGTKILAVVKIEG